MLAIIFVHVKEIKWFQLPFDKYHRLCHCVNELHPSNNIFVICQNYNKLVKVCGRIFIFSSKCVEKIFTSLQSTF